MFTFLKTLHFFRSAKPLWSAFIWTSTARLPDGKTTPLIYLIRAAAHHNHDLQNPAMISVTFQQHRAQNDISIVQEYSVEMNDGGPH